MMSRDSESESTLGGVGQKTFAPFVNGENDVIETFRKVGDPQEGTMQRILASRGVNSAQNSDEANSKTTFFESPYWPGQHDFKSRCLQDSNK